jgi:hypothetical protein
MASHDTAAILEKLANDVGRVPWSYLAPHAVAGDLWFVESPAQAPIPLGVRAEEKFAHLFRPKA